MVQSGARATLRLLGVILSLLGLAGISGAAGSDPERISVGLNGAEANGSSGGVNDGPIALSADGRFVVFTSAASNLVAGDTNGRADVFVRDRQAGATERVSVSSSGVQGTGSSGAVDGDTISDTLDISGDGRYVAFTSYSGNLVAGDTNGKADVFVRDRQTGVTERVSVASDGTQFLTDSATPSISLDGRYVAFASGGVWVRDRQTGTTERVDAGAALPGFGPSISGNGRFVAFVSSSEDLVGSDLNDARDIFVRDRQQGGLQRVSVNSAGAEALSDSSNPAISDDGRYVAFSSTAGNLVGNDANGSPDVFVRDRQTGITERVSVSSNGDESFNGSGVFNSVRISGDGRFVVFDSDAAGLAPDDPNTGVQVFVRDRQAGTTTRASHGPDAGTANGPSFDGSISGDGRVVAFESEATNLVTGDQNGVGDIFAVQIGGTAGVGADLEVTQRDSADPAPVQAPLTYTLTVRNLGPQTATSVVVTDTVPAGVSAVTVQPTPASTRGRVLTFNLGSLPSGMSATITVQVTPRGVGRITNVARVGAAQQDPTPGNNTASETTTVQRIAPPPPELNGLTVIGNATSPLDPPGPVVTLLPRGSARATISVSLTSKPTGKVTIPLTLTGPGPLPAAPTVRIAGRQTGEVTLEFGPNAIPGDYQVSAVFNGLTKTTAFKVLPVPPLELQSITVGQDPRPRTPVLVTLTLRRETTETTEIPVIVSVGEGAPTTTIIATASRRNRFAFGHARLPVGTYLFTATFGGVTKSTTFQVTR